MKTKKDKKELDFEKFESSKISKLSSINGGDDEARRPRVVIDQSQEED